MMTSEGLSSHSLYAQLVSKAQTHEHEADLYELTQLARITIDPDVFKIILDLLEINCSPKTINDVIYSMVQHSAHGEAQHPGSVLKNVSNQGLSSPSASGAYAHPSSSVSVSSSKAKNRVVGDRSRTSLADQSINSNITSRSNSGDRRSRSPTSFPGLPSRHNVRDRESSSSSHLSRVKQRSHQK